MIQLNYQNNWYEIEFEGIKIIETPFSTKLIKSILGDENESKLIIDHKNIKWKNVIYINEMSKYSDLISLNKSNFLYKQILEIIADQSLVNDQLITNIINQINKQFKFGSILNQQYDLNKIINACLEMNDLGYLNDDQFFDLLNQIEYDEKKLIIFDNVSYINYQKCQKLLNNFNVLIICSDLRKIINHYQQLELCCFLNDNFFDVVDVYKLIAFLELKLATPIKKEELNNYLMKKNDFKSQQINFYLKTI